MDLNEWKEHFNALLDKDVDNYLNENEDDLFVETPLKSKEVQKKQTKEEMMKAFRLEEADELITRALSLVRDLLPQRIPNEEWEKVHDELTHCDAALARYFEATNKAKNKSTDIVPIHEMCGISSETLMHCYGLGQWLFEQNDFLDARAIFSFLVAIAPHIPEFWISAGMCSNQMQEYQQAIDSYKLAQPLFPDNPALFIHCANNCIDNNDLINAKIELDKAKKIFDENPESKEQWSDTYTYLLSRAEKNK